LARDRCWRLTLEGLVLWIAQLLLYINQLGWVALVVLLLVALGGVTMFVRWTGARHHSTGESPQAVPHRKW
jgi:hypothetical protein